MFGSFNERVNSLIPAHKSMGLKRRGYNQGMQKNEFEYHINYSEAEAKIRLSRCD